MKRIDWQNFWMEHAELAARRSTCLRRQVGAVIVKDNYLLSSGYNGAPKGVDHCDKVGCLREQLKVPSGKMHELCRAVHAEQNAIIQAAYHGVSIKGAVMYCTHQPCIICAKMIINAGIAAVVYWLGYDDRQALDMLRDGGVDVSEFRR